MMFTLNCKGHLLTVDKPLVMGIINCTPDSFFEGSRTGNVEQALAIAGRMLAEGAALLDIGGQSTRPGSVKASANEEMERIMPVIEAICREFPSALLSVDTYYAAVARAAVNAGASMVNDISAGNMDAEMLPAIAALKVPFIAMHMQGTPQTMQQNPHYENVLTTVLDFFIQKVHACRQAGISDVIIDPGFGFGKTIAHNFELLRQLEQLHVLQCPVLVGLSRKSTIYKTLGVTAAEALNGTTVLNTIALQKGAHILRVHDVKEAIEAVKLTAACGL
jgi:dihydropteroate synthase